MYDRNIPSVIQVYECWVSGNEQFVTMPKQQSKKKIRYSLIIPSLSPHDKIGERRNEGKNLRHIMFHPKWMFEILVFVMVQNVHVIL